MVTASVRWAYAAPPGPRSHLTLPPAQRAEIRHCPVEAHKPQEALHEPGRLTGRHCRSDQWRSNVEHAEEHLHRQAGLDRGIAILWLPPALARRRRHPGHVRVEPDRQGAALLQRFVVGRPVLGLVARRDGSAHAGQLPRWIREMNPSSGLCATKPQGVTGSLRFRATNPNRGMISRQRNAIPVRS